MRSPISDAYLLRSAGENDNEDVHVDMTFDNVIFCDNLPVVPQEKYEKLITVLTKIFGQIGQIQDGEPLAWSVPSES